MMKSFELAWPVARTTLVTQGFGGNAQMYARFGLAGHNGLDFGVPVGTPVRAAADGLAGRVESRDQDGYGRHVRLTHDDGVVTIYAHLERPLVHTCQPVEAGMVIGLSGNSGFSTGPHLHFEVRVPGCEENGYGGAVDPLPLLAGRQTPSPVSQSFPEGEQRMVAAPLNLRLLPSFDDTMRGCLRKGDVILLAGEQEVEESGFCFVPVVVWAAKEYLQPLQQAGTEIG